jgi:undecaprenyl-phosphate galactose phosphotransferase
VFFYAVALIVLGSVRVGIFRPAFLILAKKNLYFRNALIVGGGDSARLLATTLALSNPYAVRVKGFLDDREPVGKTLVLGMKVLGRIKEGPSVIRKFKVREVLVALDDVSHERMLSILDSFRKTRVSIKVASPLYDVLPRRLFIERYGEIALTGIANRTSSGFHAMSKRIFDVVLTSAGLLVLAPFLILLAVLIRLDSKCPVLYKQTRIGKNGKPFKFYKFRSMKIDTDKDESRVQKVAEFIQGGHNGNGSTKIVDDSRVTRVGRLLRRTSMDELPQLINVLKGEMSLVGPRPCLPYELEHYKDWHKERLSVTPGCTGIWQVNGRSEVGFDEMVVLDLYYINNASLLLDLQLILKTIPVMLFGRGAE